MLNQLFAQTTHTEQDIDRLIEEVLQEENATFNYCEVITKGQLRLLRAIAKERKVSAPFEAAFMRKYNLSALSSVKLALKSLMDKMLISKDDDGNYYVYDLFSRYGWKNNK